MLPEKYIFTKKPILRGISTSDLMQSPSFCTKFLKNFVRFYSCGGFNTPTLCVVTKGIKADCNHLMRTTYPDARVGVVDLRIGRLH